MRKSTKVFVTLLAMALSITSFGSNDIVPAASEDVVSYQEEKTYDPTKQVVEITTKNFPELARVLKTSIYDYNQDGWLSEEEIVSLQELYLDGSVSDLKGIEYLTYLKQLVIDQYTGKAITIGTQNKALETIMVEPSASAISFKTPYVKTLIIAPVTVIAEKDGTKTVAEYSIGGGASTGTKAVYTANCTNLTALHLSIKSVTKLTLPKTNSKLTSLELEYSNLTNLDLTNSTNLKYLKMNTCSKISKLDTSANKNLLYVKMDACPKLSTFSFTKNTKLQYLYICAMKTIKNVDLTKCKNIKYVLVHPIIGTTNVTMPTGKKSALVKYGSNNFWDVSDKLYEATKSYTISYLSCNKLSTPGWYNNDDYYEKKIVKVNSVNFKDLYAVVKPYDYNSDGWFSQSEIDSIYDLRVTGKVSDLSGLKYLTNLNNLYLEEYTGSLLTISNRWLNHIRLIATNSSFTLKAPNVKTINLITQNSVKKVDLSACTNAITVNVKNENNYSTSVSTLNLPKSNTNMKSLELEHLAIAAPDLTKYTNLEYLMFYHCDKAKSLNVTKNTKLRALWFVSDSIAKLDLSKNTKLEQYIALSSNQDTKLTKSTGSVAETYDSNFWVYEVYYSMWGWNYVW